MALFHVNSDLWHYVSYWLNDRDFHQLYQTCHEITQCFHSRKYNIKRKITKTELRLIKSSRYTVQNLVLKPCSGLDLQSLQRPLEILTLHLDDYRLLITDHNHASNQEDEDGVILHRLQNVTLEADQPPLVLPNMPSTLYSLTVNCSQNHEIHNWPAHIQFLTLENAYNQPLRDLPRPLTYLRLSDSFNQSIDNLEELSLLEDLFLSGWFNRPIDYLPNNLMYLTIENAAFNQPIDHLSLPHLKYLYLAGNFDQPIDYLPCQLTDLVITGNFNQPIDHLPIQLTCLMIGGDFDQPIDHLPPDLISLHIRGNFNQSLDHLPSNLETLLIDKDYDRRHEWDFFGEFPQAVDYLPDSLRELVLKGEFNRSVDYLPSLTDLTIAGPFNQSIDHLPNTLSCLELLCENFSQTVHHWPEHLNELKIFARNNNFNILYWPELLTELELDINIDLKEPLPPHVKDLNMYQYNTLESLIPVTPVNHIEHLYIHDLVPNTFLASLAQKFPTLISITVNDVPTTTHLNFIWPLSLKALRINEGECHILVKI
jgi:hypothetical protein